MSPAEFRETVRYPDPVDGSSFQYVVPAPVHRERYWLHAGLLLITLFLSAVWGARLQQNFDRNLPFFDVERDLDLFARWWAHPASIVQGMPFALTLLSILLAHEMGHYLACRFYRVDASLPYFLPSPTLGGTLGAFIRIRAPIYTKRVLFDVGIAGPLAGFVFLLPALGIGLAFSKVIPDIARQGNVGFSTPALIRLLEYLTFSGTAPADIYLHPIARAAWIGALATALNLLPIGQLDGGHVLYSLVGARHKVISRALVAVLVPLGFFWWMWWVWAVLLFFFALRHPPIYDTSALGPGRRKLGWLALAIFILCFTLTPVDTINSF